MRDIANHFRNTHVQSAGAFWQTIVLRRRESPFRVINLLSQWTLATKPSSLDKVLACSWIIFRATQTFCPCNSKIQSSKASSMSSSLIFRPPPSSRLCLASLCFLFSQSILLGAPLANSTWIGAELPCSCFLWAPFSHCHSLKLHTDGVGFPLPYHFWSHQFATWILCHAHGIIGDPVFILQNTVHTPSVY